MNNSSIESFIDFCDDMIVEESFKNVQNKYSEYESKMKECYKKLKDTQGLKERLRVYNEQYKTMTSLKDQIKNEDVNDLKSNIKLIAYSIIPLILCTISSLEFDSNHWLKGSLTGGVGIASFYLPFKYLKSPKSPQQQKNAIISVIDNEIDNVSRIMTAYEYGLKQGAKTVEDICYAKSIENVRENLFIKNQFKGIKVLDAPDLSKSNNVDFMVNDVIAFMKKYTNSKEFKNKYKKYLYMIDIEETDYADVFSITFTSYQSGIDYDEENTDYNNDWYYEIMEVTKCYIRYRFAKWNGIIWNDISTGDGDEGTIYVD